MEQSVQLFHPSILFAKVKTYFFALLYCACLGGPVHKSRYKETGHRRLAYTVTYTCHRHCNYGDCLSFFFLSSLPLPASPVHIGQWPLSPLIIIRAFDLSKMRFYVHLPWLSAASWPKALSLSLSPLVSAARCPSSFFCLIRSPCNRSTSFFLSCKVTCGERETDTHAQAKAVLMWLSHTERKEVLLWDGLFLLH